MPMHKITHCCCFEKGDSAQSCGFAEVVQGFDFHLTANSQH